MTRHCFNLKKINFIIETSEQKVEEKGIAFFKGLTHEYEFLPIQFIIKLRGKPSAMIIKPLSNIRFQAKALLRHLFSSQTKYYMHSPFVYDLVAHVLEQKKESDDLKTILHFRKKRSLEKDKKIVFKGIGAIQTDSIKSLSEIEKKLSVPHQIAKRYYHCIQKYGYQNILEIGTCVGIGTMYLAKANPNGKVYTLEGNKDCYEYAKRYFEEVGLQNVHLIEGLFEHTLVNTLETMKSVDLVIIDGNHQYESTLAYFRQILPFIHEDSLIVLDDIHWSEGMNKAWLEIIAMKEVTLSLDFYRNGFVFFKKNRLEKENFKIWVSD